MRKIIAVILVSTFLALPARAESLLREYKSNIQWEYSHAKRIYDEKGLILGTLWVPFGVANGTWNCVASTYTKLIDTVIK